MFIRIQNAVYCVGAIIKVEICTSDSKVLEIYTNNKEVGKHRYKSAAEAMEKFEEISAKLLQY